MSGHMFDVSFVYHLYDLRLESKNRLFYSFALLDIVDSSIVATRMTFGIL